MGKKYLTAFEGFKVGSYPIIIFLLLLLDYRIYLAEAPEISFTEIEIITVCVLGFIHSLLLASFTNKTSKAKRIYLKDLVTYLPLIGAPWMAVYALFQYESLFVWFLFFSPCLLLAIGWDIANLASDIKKRNHTYHMEIN